MVFNSRSTLARWLMLNLNTELSDINFTLYNFDLTRVKSIDFVALDDLRHPSLETVGFNRMSRAQKTYQSFMTYLRMLRDVQ
jgi:hypothetical protein